MVIAFRNERIFSIRLILKMLILAICCEGFQTMTLERVYRLDTRDPKIILREGFVGTNDVWTNALYGHNTVFASRSVLGMFSYAMERILGRSGERVEDPWDKSAVFQAADLFRDRPVFAYEIDIRKLEYVEVTTSLGFSYPTLNADMHYENTERWQDVNLKSPAIAKFLPNIPLSDRRDFCRERASYALQAARYTEEVVVRGPISPKRIRLYQTLPVTPIGRRVGQSAHRVG